MKKIQFRSLLAASLLPAILFLSSCESNDPEELVPGIISISATEAPKDSLITVTGKHFLLIDTPEVLVNNISLPITKFSDDTLVVRIPKMLGSGKVTLKIADKLYEGPMFRYQYKATVTTIAGTGSVGTADGPGDQASFNHPWGITAAPNGDLFVADHYNRLIRKIDARTHEVSTIHLPVWVVGSEFYSPYNIAHDARNGDLFVTDFNQHVLRITAAGDMSVIYTGPMANAGIVMGNDGYLYVSNTNLHKIMKLSTDGTFVKEQFASGFYTPRNIILGKDNTLFVSAYDGVGAAIYKIDQNGRSELFQKLPGFKGWEIAADTLGNFYAADHFNNSLQLIEPGGRVVQIAGSGTAADADGIGLAASFDGPRGITIDKDGNIYVTTYNDDTKTGNKVRKIVVE